MDNKFELKQDDVLEMKLHGAQIPHLSKMVKISDLENHIRQLLNIQTNAQYDRGQWLGKGVECLVLRSSGNTTGWQNGRIRLNIEFIPDGPTETKENTPQNSELDSLRQ